MFLIYLFVCHGATEAQRGEWSLQDYEKGRKAVFGLVRRSEMNK